MLGSSESVGAFGHLFEVVDKQWKIFRRRETRGRGLPDRSHPAGRARRPPPGRTAAALPAPTPSTGSTGPADRFIYRRLVPPGLLVHESGDIVHIHGRTGELLEPPAGQPAHPNALDMAREGLGLDLASAIRRGGRARRRGRPARVRVRTNGHWVRADLRVERIVEPGPFAGLFLIAFERIRPDAGPDDGGPDSEPGEAARITELERELQHAKEIHQIGLEELETANEELKSTNEELQSTNEELQSTNEELETSRRRCSRSTRSCRPSTPSSRTSSTSCRTPTTT